MNRLSYRLVFNRSLGALVAVAECARGRGKSPSASGARAATTATASVALLGSLLLGAPAWAETPIPRSANFATFGQAGTQLSGNQLLVNQVGNKSILNWQKFNISPGAGVQFRQVNNLTDNALVPGASFTSLNRIWDINPSVIAGSISQGAGQQANVILVNSNGIAFMGGSQVNLNTFTASSLNIADSFITDNFLPTSAEPHFVGTGGFVKVFEGAQITAGEQGRVMLIAPTVMNKGDLSAPGGQVILAAGTKAYLRAGTQYADANDDVRGLLVEVDSPPGLTGYDEINPTVKNGELDGQTVTLIDPAYDRLANATNLGQLTATTGNVTMVGMAVNQLGIARATTSVVANGSVYLMASDTYQSPVVSELASQGSRTTNAGRVVLGEGSRTEVTPELNDATTSQDWQLTVGGEKIYQTDLERKSKVKIIGEDVRLASGSTVRANSGVVDIVALNSPRDLDGGGTSPFSTSGLTQVSDTARVHVADGAMIDVSGLSGVQISTERNTVAVELRGDELKDSPLNRNGPLRGETVYLDVEQTLKRAQAGESTLVAADSLLSYRARLGRTVAERSTTGGTVNIQSQGEAILESGSRINLSGGSVDYTEALVKSTLLTTRGRKVEVGQASADVRYDGIATRYKVDYGRWNKTEVFDSGEYTRYDPGYTEGKSAGSLQIVGMGGSVLQSSIVGKTVVGERQLAAGVQPKGAQLTIGSSAVADDFKNFQKLRLGHAYAQLPVNFGFGDTLAAEFKDNLYIDTTLLGEDKIAHLSAYTNQDAAVEQLVALPDAGSIAITARSVEVGADVRAAGGDIAFSARANAADPARPVQALSVNVVVNPGATLSTAGEWTNERLGVGQPATERPVVNGGSVTLSADGSVNLSEGATIDVSAGAWQKRYGALVYGDGGSVALQANQAAKSDNAQPGRVALGGVVKGFGFGTGGTIDVSSGAVQIGGEDLGMTNTLYLAPEWFSAGGFENIHITGREGVTLADGTVLAPQRVSRQFDKGFTEANGLILQPTGADLQTFSDLVVQPVQNQKPVNLTLKADSLAQGDIVLRQGSRTVLDAGGTLSLDAAHQISLLGSVQARGGRIEAQLSASTEKAFDPSSSIWLGESATLDASGTAVVYSDATGLPIGHVLDGGSVSLDANTGYVIAREGSVVDVSGAPPTELFVLNENGGIGRTLASSAGSVSVSAAEGMVLDGSLRAQAGSADRAGGALNIKLGGEGGVGLNFPSAANVLSLEASTSAQAGALRAGDAVPTTLNDASRLDVKRLEAGGFEQMAFESNDNIRLNDGVAIGADRALALRSLTLDAPRLELAGAAASVSAAQVQLGNSPLNRQATTTAALGGSGVLTVNATDIAVLGKSTFSGMAETQLNAQRQIALTGVAQSQTQRPQGSLTTAGDLVLNAQVVTPSTYSDFTVAAPGQSVRFEQAPGTVVQPYSAFGRLRVEAGDIHQAGSLWAPFGQIALDASGDLTLVSGSRTTVAAEAGSLLPFGLVSNGRDWFYGSASSGLRVSDLPEKSVSLEGQRVDFQSGAQINLAGGGDAQAYEFTVGPGGSVDILNTAQKPGTYAVLPGFAGSTAPRDGQESMDQSAGTAIYLQGVEGLADGVYTLLPAHYALLPGAFAVRLGQEQAVLPGQGHTRQDGTQVVAGYLTDTRVGAPAQGDWQGVQVLSRAQVLERSEFTLTPASAFFADSRFAPQDAGRLSVVGQGTGLDALQLAGTVVTQAASGGTGAAVDIAAGNLLVGASAAQATGGQSWVSSDWLNALGADSLLLGATRTQNDSGAELTVLADALTLDNAGQAALAAPEVMLAAKDTLTLAAGSRVSAQGADGDKGGYTTAGDGAFVRAASSSAGFARTGSTAQSTGTLNGSGSIVAARAITVDATRENAFAGSLTFAKNGTAVAGELGVGAQRISFGTPAQAPDGLVFSQAELDGLQGLDSLTFSSYGSFDFYGNVSVGGVDGAQRPLIRSLTLQGGGLAGFGAAGDTARLSARELTLTNTTVGTAFAAPAGQSFGSGALAVQAETLVLGAGDKQVKGFGAVTVAADQLVAAGPAGASTTINADTTLNLARITGETGAHQALDATGHALVVNAAQATTVLADSGAMGATWGLTADTLRFDTQADLRGGVLELTASAGDLTLGTAADIDVSGRSVAFFDEVRSIGGGSVALESATGDVIAQGDANGAARINVSGAPGSDAGTLTVKATQGVVELEPAELLGRAVRDADGRAGDGASVHIDADSLANFSALNGRLNAGGFNRQREFRARTGALNVSEFDVVAARKISLTADNDALTVAGWLATFTEDGFVPDDEGGHVALNGRSVTLTSTAEVYALAQRGQGGRVDIGAQTLATEAAESDNSRNIDLQLGSKIDVSGGTEGTVHLRAQRKGDEVAVTALNADIRGAREVNLEAVEVYDNKTTLNATTTGSGTTLGLGKIKVDNTTYAANHGNIKARLGKTGDAAFHMLSGVELRSSGDMTLGADWNFGGTTEATSAAAGGEAGVLTLRAGGNLNINNNLSDGFSHATANTTANGTTPATLLDATVRGGRSWSFNLVAGADVSSADVMAVNASDTQGDVSLAAGKLVRTGSGDIRIAAGRDAVLKAATSAIYTAGTRYTPPSAFTAPDLAQFSQGGGDVAIRAERDVLGTASTQLYSNWLFRQGRLAADGSSYVNNAQPAWWVRFDKFQQGVATLGGGDVSISAGGKVSNLSASAATQGYTTSATADASAAVRTGGGDVTVAAAGDVLSGQYYADLGDVKLRAGGRVGSGHAVSGRPVHTILAVGDGAIDVSAVGDVDIHAILNPHLVIQSSGTGGNAPNALSSQYSFFSSYGDNSAASLLSTTGDVTLFGGSIGSQAEAQSLTSVYRSPLVLSSTNAYLLSLLPPSLSMVAASGDVSVLSDTQLTPAERGHLELLAQGDVNLPARLTLSDADPLPDAVRPTNVIAANSSAFNNAIQTTAERAHATVPVHTGDPQPVLVYAVKGSVVGDNKLLKTAKRVQVRAGQDIVDLPMDIQHVSAEDVSLIEAGQDLVLTTSANRAPNSFVAVSGPGRLELTAGRNMELGTSAGVLSRGTLDNPNLPEGGADLHLAAGVGAAGLDYAGAIARLGGALASDAVDDSTLWLARWLAGDESLTVTAAREAVRQIAAADPDTQRERVREMLFNGVLQTGRVSNIPSKVQAPNPYAGDFSRAYRALETVFPGMGNSLANGVYQGSIDVFASRIKTEQGGGIELLMPGGGVIVGLSNTPAALVDTSNARGKDAGPLGIITVGAGDIRMLARDDVLVNQSRVLTAAGGDILIWSSEGDIDAGKGKKTATAVPPPIIKVEADGSVTQEIQAAASGSGIGALQTGDVQAGDVDLIAPKGTVNAGDAGIRAGNLNIAALVVLGADNISVSGSTTGAPVADTSAVTAASSGATTGGDDSASVVESLNQAAAESAKAAQELAEALRPYVVRVEVLGYGN